MRHGRPGDVGHHEVERAGAGDEPREALLDGRGRVRGGLQHQVGPSGSRSRLRRLIVVVDAVQAAERVGLVAGQLGEHERDVIAEHVVELRTLTGTITFSATGCSPRSDQVGAHAAGDRGQHHVVDRRAVGALDDAAGLRAGARAQARRRSGESDR